MERAKGICDCTERQKLERRNAQIAGEELEGTECQKQKNEKVRVSEQSEVRIQKEKNEPRLLDLGRSLCSPQHLHESGNVTEPL